MDIVNELSRDVTFLLERVYNCKVNVRKQKGYREIWVSPTPKSVSHKTTIAARFYEDGKVTIYKVDKDQPEQKPSLEMEAEDIASRVNDLIIQTMQM